MVLNFRYHAIDGATNGLRKPTIPVEFKMNSGGYVEVMCLIDSGSDVIVLPKGIADLINLKIHEKSTSNGIEGEVPVDKGYASFRIKKERGYHTFNAKVEVLHTDDIPVILGRQGFFDRFKITIDKKNKKVTLKEHSPKISKKINKK